MTEYVVIIEEHSDAFAITVNGERFYFNQEDSIEGLVDVFAKLGIEAEYEEVY